MRPPTPTSDDSASDSGWDKRILTKESKNGFHREMLIMLIMLSPYSRKMLVAGEVLIMLTMLNQNGDSWGDLEMGFNIINISAARSKKCFRQGKC